MRDRDRLHGKSVHNELIKLSFLFIAISFPSPAMSPGVRAPFHALPSSLPIWKIHTEILHSLETGKRLAPLPHS